MSLNSGGIITAIAQLSITGIRVLDVTALPNLLQGRTNEVPCLIPDPVGMVTGGAGTGSIGMATFGTPSTHYWQFSRTYRYQYLHAKVGTGRGIQDHYSDLCNKSDRILEALTTLNVTNVDVLSINVGNFGTFGDPSGNEFFGFSLDINVREVLNG